MQETGEQRINKSEIDSLCKRNEKLNENFRQETGAHIATKTTADETNENSHDALQ